MAANIPAKLKQAGITPFVLRAAQLESAKPVISYWCEYWAVNQILSKQLHNADEECHQFTISLMDKLEQTKAAQAANEAIHDDAAGQAYVEQFALETFERALRPLRANKVTQQTASTFEAAATFLQLINIWHPPDAETTSKIKFAKWNAARILRAIKAGEDPNDSNPKQEEETLPALDPNDPEVQAIAGGELGPRPATVEDEPGVESSAYLDPAAASGNASFSPAPVSAPTSPPHSAGPAPEQVSPIAPPDQTTHDGYFPSVPGPAEDAPLQLPSAPAAIPPPVDVNDPPEVLPSLGGPSPALPSPAPFSPTVPNLPDTPQDYYRPSAPQQPSMPASAPTPPFLPLQPPHQQYQPPPPSTYTPHQPAPRQPHYQPPPPHHSQPLVPTFTPPPPAVSAPPPAPYQPQPPQPQAPTGGYVRDDLAMAQAQKHAKWAISALNFEDVPTAVKELRNALAVLGATPR